MKQRKHAYKGYTLVEAAIVAAVAGVLMMGVVALIAYLARGRGIIWSRVNLTTQAREAMNYIGRDFTYAKASTMGNIALKDSVTNAIIFPGFETPTKIDFSGVIPPDGWTSPLPAGTKRTGYSGGSIKTGVTGMSVETGMYDSDLFTVSPDNYILSGWIVNGGTLSLRDTANTDVASVTNSSGLWRHNTTTVNIGASQDVKLSIGLPLSTNTWIEAPHAWSDWAHYTSAMAVYNDAVFFGDWESGGLYYLSGTTFPSIANTGQSTSKETADIFVYDNPNDTTPGEKLYVIPIFIDWADSTSWILWSIKWHMGNVATANWNVGWPAGAADYSLFSTDSGWGTGFHGWRCSVVGPGNILYVGYYGKISVGAYAQVRRYDPSEPAATRWRVILRFNDPVAGEAAYPPNPLPDLSQPPFSFFPQRLISALAISEDGQTLFAASANGNYGWSYIPDNGGSFASHIYRYDLTTPDIAPTDTDAGNNPVSWRAVTSMIWFKNSTNGKLFAAAGDLFRLDSTGWTAINTLGWCLSVFEYNGDLYVGTKTGKLWRSSDGNTFTEFSPTIPTASNFWIYKMLKYNGLLLVAGGDVAGGSGGNGWGIARVYIYGAGAYFDDLSLSPQDVVFSNGTTYTYCTSKGSSDSQLNKFKMYRLRYASVAATDPAFPGKLYREYSPDNGQTWSPDGLTSDGVICKNVKKFEIINHNQESFELELILETLTSGGQKKEYKIKDIFTPTIS